MLTAPIWHFFKKGQDSNEAKSFSWRDQTLRFDLKQSGLALGAGEVLIGSSYPIEDIKGNLGQSGFGPVLNAFRGATRTALGETCESICILAKYESVKYEFIFKRLTVLPTGTQSDRDRTGSLDVSLADGATTIPNQQQATDGKATQLQTQPSRAYRSSIDPCELVIKVWNAYRTTTSFRRCRVNLSSLHTNGEINLLNSEEIHERYMNISYKNRDGVWLDGILILTNIRIVWMLKKNHNENMSIPYIQVESVCPHTRFRDSYWRFVLDLKVVYHSNVLSTYSTVCTMSLRYNQQIYCRYSERYIDQKKFEALCEQISNLTNTYKERPRFGPEVSDECRLFMQQLRRKSRTDDGGSINLKETTSLFDLPKAPIDHTMDDLVDDIDSSLIKSGYKTAELTPEHKQSFYHNGTGLAFESTTGNTSIQSIWRIDV